MVKPCQNGRLITGAFGRAICLSPAGQCATVETPARADDMGYNVAVLLEDIDPGESGGTTLRSIGADAMWAGLIDELLAFMLGASVLTPLILEVELAEPWLPQAVKIVDVEGKLRPEPSAKVSLRSIDMLPLLLLGWPDNCGARGGLIGLESCVATCPFTGGGGVAVARLPDVIRIGCGIVGLDISRDIEDAIADGPGGGGVVFIGGDVAEEAA